MQFSVAWPPVRPRSTCLSTSATSAHRKRRMSPRSWRTPPATYGITGRPSRAILSGGYSRGHAHESGRRPPAWERNEARVKVEPEAAGMSEARLERITRHFEENYVAPGKITGCQVTVVRAGHVAYHRSLGLMDREQERPMRDDAIFRIFSMTKPIASVALMQLYERGMFQLTDPVHRFIPQWRALRVGEVQPDGSITKVKPQRPMNVRDVLMHTTGLPGGLFPGNPIDDEFASARDAQRKGMTLEKMTDLLAQYPLKFHPGTHWNYGLSTDIVGRLVEILAEDRFDDYPHR